MDKRPTDDELDDLELLLEHIRAEHAHWRLFGEFWIGRKVMLREDIRTSRDGADGEVLVPRGAIGEIVGLNRDENAPFSIRFPEFPIKVAALAEKLEFVE